MQSKGAGHLRRLDLLGGLHRGVLALVDGPHDGVLPLLCRMLHCPAAFLIPSLILVAVLPMPYLLKHTEQIQQNNDRNRYSK